MLMMMMVMMTMMVMMMVMMMMMRNITRENVLQSLGRVWFGSQGNTSTAHIMPRTILRLYIFRKPFTFPICGEYHQYIDKTLCSPHLSVH